MTRDSVGMADDVDAPHERSFELPQGASLTQVAKTVASSSYLPMPSDAWGWTIEAGGATIAVRPRLFRRETTVLQGDPESVTFEGIVHLTALYVRPGSPWHSRP